MSIDLSDLGLAPVQSAGTLSESETLLNVIDSTDDHTLEVGSLLARALYHVWIGDRSIVVESPPGAGKTTLITQVVYHLMRDSDLTVAIACPTRRGATDLAARLVDVLGDIAKVVFSVKGEAPPNGAVSHAPGSTRSVVVRTARSCAFGPPDVDLMIFDEAYQTTYSDAAKASSASDQVLMVGDPGQIGPVVKVKGSFWKGAKVVPSSRAPESFAALNGAVVLSMDATFRVGQDTVDVIAPLYGFDFVSKRPQRHLIDGIGRQVPEITATQVGPVETRADLELMQAIANKALSFIETEVNDTLPDGTIETSAVRPEDIAIIVAHNDQSSLLSALLRNASHPSFVYPGEGEKIYVGTADRSQGGQWKVVISLDPMIARADAGAHQLSLGRLCVMLSRHTHHLLWLHDGKWENRFAAIAESSDASKDDVDDAHRSIAVRRILCQHDNGDPLRAVDTSDAKDAA